jgi:hypothetical protein
MSLHTHTSTNTVDWINAGTKRKYFVAMDSLEIESAMKKPRYSPYDAEISKNRVMQWQCTSENSPETIKQHYRSGDFDEPRSSGPLATLASVALSLSSSSSNVSNPITASASSVCQDPSLKGCHNRRFSISVFYTKRDRVHEYDKATFLLLRSLIASQPTPQHVPVNAAVHSPNNNLGHQKLSHSPAFQSNPQLSPFISKRQPDLEIQ